MNYSDIINTLSNADIDVALPAAKQGICTSPYVVVQSSGTYPYAISRSLCYSLVTVRCFVPLNSYQLLDTLVRSVSDALAPLAPDLRATGNQSLHSVNDKFRAHECSVQYLFQHRI